MSKTKTQRAGSSMVTSKNTSSRTNKVRSTASRQNHSATKRVGTNELAKGNKDVNRRKGGGGKSERSKDEGERIKLDREFETLQSSRASKEEVGSALIKQLDERRRTRKEETRRDLEKSLEAFEMLMS